jgi:hypothetical protein
MEKAKNNLMNPKLKLGKLGLYVIQNEPGKPSEISFESMTNWFDWRVNFLGKDFTIWLELD